MSPAIHGQSNALMLSHDKIFGNPTLFLSALLLFITKFQTHLKNRHLFKIQDTWIFAGKLEISIIMQVLHILCVYLLLLFCFRCFHYITYVAHCQYFFEKIFKNFSRDIILSKPPVGVYHLCGMVLLYIRFCTLSPLYFYCYSIICYCKTDKIY